MGVGVVKTREPKSVTVGIQQRGLWYIIGDGRDERALEIEIVEDAVMYGCEPLEFKLDVSCMEPLEESNFIVMQERSLKDISDSLTLLCMHQRVVDVARNGRLNVRYVTYVRLFLD